MKPRIVEPINKYERYTMPVANVYTKVISPKITGETQLSFKETLALFRKR